MSTTHTLPPTTYEVSVVVSTPWGRPKVVRHWSATASEVAALLEDDVEMSGDALQIERHNWMQQLPSWMHRRRVAPGVGEA